MNELSQIVSPPTGTMVAARRRAIAAAPAASPSPAAVLLNTWRAVAHWWTIAAPAGIVLAALAAGFVWFRFEPQYRAAAWIQIQETPTHLAYPTQDNPRRFVQNQIELLRSTLVLGPVVADPELATMPQLQQQDDPIQWLSRRLRVANVGDSELFEVSFDSHDPSGAARLVNAVVKSYLSLRNEHDASRSHRMLELLEEEKNLRAQEVTRLRENVRELSREILGKDPFTGQPSADVVVVNHPLEALMNQLTAAEVDRKMLEVQLEAVSRPDRQAREIPAAIVTAAVDRHPEIQELKYLLSGKQAMLDRIEEASKHGKADPTYLRIEREVQRLEQSIARTRLTLKKQVQEELQADAALKQGDGLTAMEQSLLGKRAAETTLREQYESQLKLASKTGSQSLELEFARSELTREEKVFELIAQRALALRTETRAPNRVSPMKPATVPVVPIEHYPLKHMLLALAAGFCAPFGLAVLWERWVKRIADPEQLDQQTSMSVVGEVARLPLRHRTSLSGHLMQRDLSLFEESVDSLRTCLILGQSDHVRVIAVASAVSGEGKTSVAAQLAVSLARSSGQKTLIIDADMRSPDIHQMFQISNDNGLAAILEDGAPWADCINTEWSEFVHVLPAGRASANPHALVNSARFQQLLQEVREVYAHVVIDTPPILLASEALVIAKEADGALLCTMRDHSRERQVKAADERLRAVGAHVLGAVLSGIPARQYEAKYGNYSYS